jgi:PAS domain S-box-containing protein
MDAEKILVDPTTLRRVSCGLALAAAAIGVLVLAGWALQLHILKSGIPGFPMMMPNTALSFVLAGLALALLGGERSAAIKSPAWHRVAHLCAALVALVGLATLFEYTFGWDLGIDGLLLPNQPGLSAASFPGRPSPQTALTLLLAGAALLLQDVRLRRGWPSVWLAMAGFLIPLLALVGYVFGVPSFFAFSAFTGMAVHTALTFLLLFAGILLTRPEHGFTNTLFSCTAAGTLMRRLLPAAILVPFTLGWLRLLGQRAGFYGMEFGLTLFAVGTMLAFTLIVLWNASLLYQAETDRRRAEDALRVSKERYRLLFENNPHPVWVYDLETSAILDVNAAALRHYGYSREEFLSLTIKDIRPPEDPPVLLESAARANADRELTGTWRHRKKDGSVIYVDVSSHKMLFAERPVRLVVATDITERKEAEALRASETRFRRLLESAPDAMVIVDGQGRILLSNAQATMLFGYPPEELAGRPVEILMPERFHAGHVVHRMRYAGAPRSRPMGCGLELYGQRRDGHEFPVEISLAPIETAEGVLISAAIRDVTERRAQEARARLAAIVESSDDAILSRSLDGTILSWNRGAERLFGYTAAEALSNNVSMLVPPDRRDEEPHILQRIQRGERVEHFETQRIRKDGRRIHVSITVSPVRGLDGQVTGASTIARDITEQKQAVVALAESTARLARANNELQALNNELEAFSYSVSHDLRAPVRQMDGFARILAENYSAALNPEAHRCLDHIQEGARHMRQLIDDLLNLSRVSRRTLQKRPTDLNAVLAVVLEEIKRETGQRCIEWRVSRLPVVECDPTLTRVLFTNLVSNAVKYTRPRADAVIEIGEVHRNGQSAIFIRDNGVGFDMRYAGKLFDVFQRLHRPEEFEGTGVGLATVQRIVHKHGGQVWGEGQVNQGATFYFTLTEPEAPARQVHQEANTHAQ